MAHKEREAGKKGGEAAAELKSDLKDMEKEREVILDRVDKIKSRAESNLHLLQVAHELRVERDRDHELSMQKIQEKETLSSLQVINININSIKLFFVNFILCCLVINSTN